MDGIVHYSIPYDIDEHIVKIIKQKKYDDNAESTWQSHTLPALLHGSIVPSCCRSSMWQSHILPLQMAEPGVVKCVTEVAEGGGTMMQEIRQFSNRNKKNLYLKQLKDRDTFDNTS